MKRIALALTLALLSGCATTGGGNLFAPDILSANERSVTIYDAWGVPGMAEQAAASHCSRFGRIAQYQGRGGPGFQCSGRSYNLCSTYLCVQ